MPRRSGGGRAAPARSAPSRPTVAPARPSAPTQRNASTAAAQPPAKTQQAQAGQSSGLFGQMASTAAGVAVGSTIGHALGGFFGGGSTQAAETQQADSGFAAQDNGTYQSTAYGNCEDSAKAFTRCLDENNGSQHQMSICSFYLDQLKACQAAASKY